MGRMLIFESLEIERVQEEEQRALKQGPEVAQQQQERAVRTAVAQIKSQQEEDDVEDTPTDEPAEEGSGQAMDDAASGGDSGDSADSDSADAPQEGDEQGQVNEEEPAEEDSNATPDEKLEQAKESFRRFDPPSPSLEEFTAGDAAGMAGQALSTGASKAYAAGSWVVKSLASLGSQYGPGILMALGKGLLLVLAKLVKGLGSMFSALARANRNRQASVRVLSKEVQDLKEAVEEAAKTSTDPSDIEGMVYKKIQVIDSFKIGLVVDPSKVIDELNKFIEKSMAAMADATLTDLKALDHMSGIISQPSEKDLVSALVVPMDRSGLYKGSLLGEKIESYAVEELYYGDPLPGDMLFRALLPVSNLRSLKEFEQAYSESEIALKFNKPKYRSVESVPVLNVAQLQRAVASLEKTIELLRKQESYYRSITNAQPGVMNTIKRYVKDMLRSKVKLPLEQTMVEPMYLKSKFVSSVYLSGMMDTHVYTARTVNAVLHYCRFSLTYLRS